MSKKSFSYPIELDIAINSNFLNKIDLEKGNASPYYNLEEEITHIISPIKILYGNDFIKQCQRGEKTCIDKMKEDYEKTNDYIHQKYFNNVQIYNNTKDCKKIARDNDLSYYWCKNKKNFYNYKFEIFFLIINIITCLFVFLFHHIH